MDRPVGQSLSKKVGFGIHTGLLGLALCLGFRADAAVNLLEGESWRFGIAGFVELDTFNDSTGSLTEIAGNNPVGRPNTQTGANGRTQFSPRNSRVAFSLMAPPTRSWQSKGYLEFDLLGYNPAPGPGNSESAFYTNPTLRLRHAFLQSESEGWRLLAGQSWSLFGWQPNYVLTTVSLPPVAGVLYERALQVTAVKSLPLSSRDKVEMGLSVVRPVQRDSTIPGLDAGVRLALGGIKGSFAAPNGDILSQPLSLALSASARDLSTPQATPGKVTHYLGAAMAADLLVPIVPSVDGHEISNTLVFTSELSLGQGYADQFTGFSGNLPQFTHQTPTTPNLDAGQAGYTPGGQFQVVNLMSWNASLQYHFPRRWHTFANAGYGRLSSNNVGALQAAKDASGNFLTPYARAEVAFVNVFHDFSDEVRAAVEYNYIQTQYVDNVYAHNDRVQISGWFRF